MNLRKIAAAPLALMMMLFIFSVPAHGNAIFHFSYSIPFADGSGTGVTADGDFITSDIDGTGTYYTVLDIVGGRWNGLNITGLWPVNGFLGNDNQLNATAPFLTGNGISFSVSGAGDDGAGNVNVYFAGSGYTEPPMSLGYGTFDVTLVQEPEPGTGVLVLLAVPLIWQGLRRKQA